jgi:hypothetical protein
MRHYRPKNSKKLHYAGSIGTADRCPLGQPGTRIGSLAQMRVDKNLHKQSGEYWVRLQSAIVKNKRGLEYSLPLGLEPCIDRYFLDRPPPLISREIGRKEPTPWMVSNRNLSLCRSRRHKRQAKKFLNRTWLILFIDAPKIRKKGSTLRQIIQPD